MSRIGIVLVTAALASTSAWAQSTSQGSAQKSGAERPRGVVTGSSGDGGIALQSDAAKQGGAVSGGVSVNARDNLRSQVPPHNVKMVFALNTGNYLSDVDVKVTDRSGKVVIQDVSNGPWLYAQLPAGSYTATATYNGSPKTHRFTVGKSGIRTAQFRWPASVEQQAGGSAAGEASGSILGTGPQEAQR